MTDFILDENYDLKIVTGDFVIGESTDQNVELIFKSTPGEWKEYLEAGIAIERAIGGGIDRFIDRTIRVQMAADGYEILELQISETGIKINGNYAKI